MPDQFTYDLFISYSSKDAKWAKRLETDLSKRGVKKCFLDQLRLRKGEKWEQQLLGDLLASRHFVVLWSDNSKTSDWVSQELYRFKGEIDPKGEGTLNSGRMLHAINLQGQNATLSAFQGFDRQELQQAYAASADPDKLDAAAEQAWNEVVGELSSALVGGSLQVPCAVLALTDTLLAKNPPELTDYDVPDLSTFLTGVGVGSVPQWQQRYGADSFAWRPFGQDTIKTLLQRLVVDPKTGINVRLQLLGKQPIKWAWIDVVSPPVPTVEQLATSFQAGPSLLVIDPISLFSYPIYRRYVALKSWFINPQAAVVLLNPIGLNQPLEYLQQFLATQSKPNLESYYEPIPYNPGLAACGINVADTTEIRRLILTSIGRQTAAPTTSAARAILGT